MLLNFASDCPASRPDVLVMVVSLLNTAPLAVHNVQLQAAVPKVGEASFPLLKCLVCGENVYFNLLKDAFFQSHQSMKVKLQPPSATELAPFNPILPPASITQIMLLANPTKVRRLVQTHTESAGDVANGVHPHRRRCECVTSWPSHSGSACATRWVKWTSSPRRKRGGAYSSVRGCRCSAGMERFILAERV